jgi:hypothetical protein
MIITFVHTLLGELEKSSVHNVLSLLDFKYNIEEIGRLVKGAAARIDEKFWFALVINSRQKSLSKMNLGRLVEHFSSYLYCALVGARIERFRNFYKLLSCGTN